MELQHSQWKVYRPPAVARTMKTGTVLSVVFISFLATGVIYGYPGPTTALPDSQLTTAIMERLKMDARVDPSRMQIEVKQGRAILSGLVETLEEKFLAEQITATSIIGLKGITNNITVRPTLTKDDALEQRITTQLRTIPALSDHTFKVSVNHGMVKLEGSVQKPRDRKLAEKAVEAVPGVSGIVNLIEPTGPQRQDADIHKDVKTYLTYSPLINLADFDYRVEKGVIKLKGMVDQLAYRDMLGRDLDKIDGVVEVDLAGVHIKSQPMKG